MLRGGTYDLQAPLALGAHDGGTAESTVVWRAEKGEQVRLSGRRTITGWRAVTDPAIRARLDPAVRDKVLQIDLKAQGITDYGEMSGGFGREGSTGLELFLDRACGVLCDAARTMVWMGSRSGLDARLRQSVWLL